MAASSAARFCWISCWCSAWVFFFAGLVAGCGEEHGEERGRQYETAARHGIPPMRIFGRVRARQDALVAEWSQERDGAKFCRFGELC